MIGWLTEEIRQCDLSGVACQGPICNFQIPENQHFPVEGKPIFF